MGIPKEHLPWNKGKKGVMPVPWNKGREMSLESKRKMSLAKKGKKTSLKTRKKQSEANKKLGIKPPIMYGKNNPLWKGGKPKCKKCGFEVSYGNSRCRKCYLSSQKGPNHSNWKGGITPINKKIRASIEYKLWRIAVFERDNYTCVWCGAKKSPFNADHIKPFSLYPELRFAIDNGRTLCVPCHQKTDTFMGKIRNYKKNE